MNVGFATRLTLVLPRCTKQNSLLLLDLIPKGLYKEILPIIDAILNMITVSVSTEYVL